jgi:hypothetical protein
VEERQMRKVCFTQLFLLIIFQLSVFHGSVECGLASFPDIYVRLEEPQTLDFIRKFVPKDANDFDDEKQ